MSETLDRFRAAVLADEAFQLQLASLPSADAFASAALAGAAERGIALEAAELEQAFATDPVGGSLLLSIPPRVETWPPRHWLPLRYAIERSSVDWIHFAGEPLQASFFGQDCLRLRALPFNALFACSTRLDDFLKAPRDHAHAPDGFIFHMSRCGSTLVSQMLASVGDNVVVSEAEPLDTILQLRAFDPRVSPQMHVEAVRAMVAALGRDRSGRSRRTFVKLDSWHTLALPLFRAAFPDTPWVFLYRDPIEVLVSQLRLRGRQVVPGIIPPEFLGFPPNGSPVPNADYIARVLARICEAVIEHMSLGGGMLVEYDTLPEAVFTRVLPHFHVEFDAAERAAMLAASLRDAKSPQTVFQPDSEAKRGQADDEIRAAAERHLGAIYGQLNALRADE